MAAQVDIKDVKRTEDLAVWPDDVIVEWENNGRYSKIKQGDVIELAKKILDQGQLQSVGCRRGVDKKLYLAFGFRRWMAVKYINEKLQPNDPIRIRVRLLEGNELDAFTRNISENRERKAVNLLDDAHNQKILRERFQWEDEKIAEFYNCTVAYVGQLAKILELSEPVKKAIQEDVLAPTAALRIAQQGLPEADQIKLLKQFESEAPPEGSAGETAGKDPAKKKKKISTAKVEKAIRDHKAESGQAGPSRRISDVKKFYLEVLDAEDYSDNIKNLAGVMIGWIEGKKTDKQLSNAIAKIEE